MDIELHVHRTNIVRMHFDRLKTFVRVFSLGFGSLGFGVWDVCYVAYGFVFGVLDFTLISCRYCFSKNSYE